MSKKLTVVLSQAQGKNPTKRALEESLAAALIMENGLDVSIVPYLYDLGPDHTGRLFLESVSGDMVVLSWMYPRATFWLLDRIGIKGHEGEVLLKAESEDEEEDLEEAPEPQGIGAVEVPDRHIYCLDLRDFSSHTPYVEEIQRIRNECQQRHAANAPVNMVQLGVNVASVNGNGHKIEAPQFSQEDLLQQPKRRWYPVIDYSRCTNCLECLDFCLFGVYDVNEVEGEERITVENQDSCKKGCPACSRVCPEHAIMFPDYKTPAIAGAPVGNVSGLKIDLSRLFGGDDAISMAAKERDQELVADGRDAVGMSVGIPKRQEGKADEPRDELDDLMDELDDLDI